MIDWMTAKYTEVPKPRTWTVEEIYGVIDLAKLKPEYSIVDFRLPKNGEIIITDRACGLYTIASEREARGIYTPRLIVEKVPVVSFRYLGQRHPKVGDWISSSKDDIQSLTKNHGSFKSNTWHCWEKITE